MSSKSNAKPSSKANAKSKNKNTTSNGNVSFRQTRSNGRVSVNSLVKHPIFGGRLTSNSETLPAAFVNILGNSTYFSESSVVMNPDLGLCPVNIVGSQPMTDITGAVATPDCFVSGTLATAASVNFIQLSPDAFNGPLAARANLYDKYVFRDILLEYVSTCATSQANALGICLVEDGSSLGAPTSFSTVRQCVPSVAFPLRCDRAFLHYHYKGPSLWYTALDTASNAATRLTIQGGIFGYASANLGVITPGFINVYYSIDLYDPVLTQGFTMSLTRDQRDVVRELVAYAKTLSPDDAEKYWSSMVTKFTGPVKRSK